MVKTNKPGKTLLFDKRKYTLMIIGLVFIALGFILMIGGGSDDPAKFSEDIFSFRRITLAPILVMFGFVLQIYVILSKKSSESSEEKPPENN